jgi:hypothetical protein
VLGSTRFPLELVMTAMPPESFLAWRAAARLVLMVALLGLAACGGGSSGSGSTPSPGVTAPALGNLTLTGTATFDKVPFNAISGTGLDFTRTAPAPARGVTIEAIGSASQSVLATAVSDGAGQYTLSVPANTEMLLRMKAELRRSGAPSWLVTVRDNTSGDALYAVDTAPFNSGAAALRRDVHAGSGWNGSSFAGTRAAAPMSVLDAAWQAMQLVLGAEPGIAFPELKMFWSARNVPCSEGAGGFCNGTSAARARGEIGTSFYAEIGTQGPSIYVLGAADSDSDEFDQHVVAHEWGHYYQDNFSRDDSLGGPHSLNERLDLRVAFSEGWGNAFAGMVKGDPVYRDSFGAQQRGDFSINVENNAVTFPGWFSEASVQSVFYDAFDVANDGVDTVSLGFAPIHAAMRGAIRTTPAFTSVYALVNALRAAQPGQAGAIGALATGQLVTLAPDDFGTGETNAGGSDLNIPIFPPMTSGTTRPICSSLPTGGTAAMYNKLGNRRFLRFTLQVGSTVSIVARNGRSGTDPDIVLYAAGVERGRAEGETSGTETLTLPLQAGTYVAEVYEYSNINGTAPRGTECFDVTLTIS